MKMKASMLIMLCLLVVLVSAPSSAAVLKPRYFVIGEGNFEAFDLGNDAAAVTNVPYDPGYFENHGDQTYFLEATKDDSGHLKFKKSVMAVALSKVSKDKITGKPSTREKVADAVKDARWKIIRHNGRASILISNHLGLSPDRSKLIINSLLDDELWILDAEKNQIQVSNLNGKIHPSGFEEQPVIWFARASWSKDGKMIAYSSNKMSLNDRTSVWVYGDGKDRRVMDAQKYGASLSVLGWTCDGSIVVALERERLEVGICDLSGEYHRLALNACAYSESGISPDGRFMVARKINAQRCTYGLILMDLKNRRVYDIQLPLDYCINGIGVYGWSQNSRRVAFVTYEPTLDDPKKPYTTGTKLAVLAVGNENSINLAFYDSPVDDSWFYLGGAVSWLGNNTVVANLTDQSSIVLEVN